MPQSTTSIASATGGVRPGSEVTVRRAMLAAFTAVFILSIVHNDFPFVYHPDEPAKVAQIISGARDYHHPPLMLELTRGIVGACGALGGTPSPQSVAQAGRWLSAVAVALAAALLTWLASVYGGKGGAVCAAAALGTNVQAVLAGHFLKEDALFALGLALTFCAGAIHWRRRTWISLLGLGAASGFALSCKYVGLLAVAYALVLAAAAGEGRGFKRWSAKVAAASQCLAFALAVFLLIDADALAYHFEDWKRGIDLGVSVSQQGNKSIGAQVPNLHFLGMFFLFTPLSVLVGAGAFWVGLRAIPFRTAADRWLAGLSPLWLVAVFSFSASTAVRYFLPVSLMLDCVAGAAFPGLLAWALERWAGELGRTWSPRAPVFAGVFILLMINAPAVWTLAAGFAMDDRVALRTWIAENLPASAVIVEDALAHLEDRQPGERPMVQQIMSKPCVADFGDVATLRAEGVSYVAVCWYDSRRYVDTSKRPGADADVDFERRRAFYRSLPDDARRVWESPLVEPYAVRPGLELFALDAK